MNLENKTIVRAARDIVFVDGIQIYIGQKVNGQLSIAEPIVMKAHDNGLPVSAPQLTLTVEEAQVLMDSLWDCGIRPTSGAGSAGAMAAVQAHLADLQRLVFNKEK